MVSWLSQLHQLLPWPTIITTQGLKFYIAAVIYVHVCCHALPCSRPAVLQPLLTVADEAVL